MKRYPKSALARWMLAGITALGAIVLLAWLVFQVTPDLFTPRQAKGFTAVDEARARTDVRTSALQFLGGLILVFGAFYTARTFRLNRERQITERFTAAVEQLARAELEVRVGGIYALGRIAVQSRDYHDAVIQVLAAFAKNHAPRTNDDGRIPPGLDMQAVVSVLRSRTKYRRLEDRLELRAVDLHRASLTEADLHMAWLSDVDLRDARLVWAKLNGARLGGADLQGALMAGADLRNSYLGDANLTEADLRGADLRGADLRGEHGLVDLSKAHLDGTEVTEEQLRRGEKLVLPRERWLIAEFDDEKLKLYRKTVSTDARLDGER